LFRHQLAGKPAVEKETTRAEVLRGGVFFEFIAKGITSFGFTCFDRAQNSADLV
jgi:hypothetical protein